MQEFEDKNKNAETHQQIKSSDTLRETTKSLKRELDKIEADLNEMELTK